MSTSRITTDRVTGLFLSRLRIATNPYTCLRRLRPSHTRTHSHTNAPTHSRKRTQMHTCRYAHTHTDTHTTHTHTHTYTHTTHTQVYTSSIFAYLSFPQIFPRLCSHFTPPRLLPFPSLPNSADRACLTLWATDISKYPITSPCRWPLGTRVKTSSRNIDGGEELVRRTNNDMLLSSHLNPND